jgi:membrane-associated phospholipid phosphatase
VAHVSSRTCRLVSLVFPWLLAWPGLPARAEESVEPRGASASTDTAQVAEQAEERARIAEPKPLQPSPHDPRRPAFQLYAEYDLPVLGIGLVFAASRLVGTQKAYCAPLCDPDELNGLDRKTAGYWSPAWQLSSDVGLYTLAASSAILLIADEGFMNALNDGVVIAESALAAMATASIMTLAAARPRPFLYGEDAPLHERNDADASLSFLSSHAATAFATATATFMASRRLHPTRKLPFLVAGIGGALATLVAVARVLGGKHFITDALGGSVVGVSLGVLIPALHGSPVRVVPNASAEQRGLSLAARF